MAPSIESFEEHRRPLLGLAYRMTGSMWDAEDLVQEAYLRWMRADRSTVREPRAFLMTVVSRLALDQLRSARATREAYTGPWLPEPVATDELGPLDTAELRDTVSYATMHLLERLSPPERAVFLLREAFGLPYQRIAEMLELTPGACRQAHYRAQHRLADGADRFRPSGAEHREILRRFLDAARGGDLAELTSLLGADVVAWNDGGGKVRAALRPIVGRDDVLTFIAGLVARYPMDAGTPIDVNGEPAVRLTVDGVSQVVTLGIRDGRIESIFAVLNPDKLRHAPA
jgi:RNA polymerase sigma-70 factor (ECF subfamily)